MQQIVFTKASNGQATCTVNGIHLHSSYNPSHEAAIFVSSIKCTFIPKFILITGPGLSYCSIPLRKLYPSATLCAVQYTNAFASADHYLWDHVFSLEDSSISLSEQIFQLMGDEGIASCLFLSWQPSERAFPDAFSLCWKEIKNAVLKSRTVLATKSFFARRWTRNAIRFCLFTKQTVTAINGTSPILLCASGPSLRTSLPFIQKFQEYCTIVCVSSALSPLIANNIIPDICVSTDGGFYAKRHLSFALQKAPSVVLSLPSESASYASALETHKILPLKYGDGPGDTLLDSCGFISYHGVRNGTVSGTAAFLALQLTSAPVFFCGLDLSSSKGFTHTQPNELEIADSCFDNRLSTLETRITPSTFDSPSLDLYRSWFSTADFAGRLFRLSNKWEYKNNLGLVKDVDWNFFGQALSKCVERKKTAFVTTAPSVPFEKRLDIMQKIIDTHIASEDWLHDAVPAESVIYERSKNTSNEKAARKAVDRAMSIFYKDIVRSFGKGFEL